MTRVLYGRGQSRSFRCLWALNEAGISFEYIEITPATKPDNYAELNSQGKVPTLSDGDLRLTESAAIVNYAGMLSKEKGLIPEDVVMRARYDEICYFVMTELEQPLWTIGKHRFAIPEEHRHEVIFETAAWEFRKALDTLTHLVGRNSFSAGSHFTFADLLIAHTINWAQRFEMQVDRQWLDFRDVQYERPGCQKSLALVS